jgi:hypothetical protein
MTEPTDKELEALIAANLLVVEGGQCAFESWADIRPELVKFTRAVLAKWGTPQPAAAEFALQALVAAGHVSQALVDKALSLPGAPQPVVREPLGNKELQAISLDYSDSEDECTGFRDGWRFAEKHYGITKNGGRDAN